MEKHDPKISAIEVAKIFKKMDRDGNGQITFEGLLNKFPFSLSFLFMNFSIKNMSMVQHIRCLYS